MISTGRRNSRTSKEMKLRANSVLDKVSLNEGGRELDLMLMNISSSLLLFSIIREPKNHSLDFGD